MARGGAKKAKLTVVGGTGNLTHDNTKNALSDDQILALTLQHKRHYENALKAKKAADASFKDVCKKAKAELGDTAILDIKDMIEAESDGYEAKLQAELERKARLARWLNLDVGSQGNLFDNAGTAPSQRERGYAEGKRQALEGKECKTDFSPGTEGYDGYMEGWHAGAAIKTNMDREQEEGAAVLLRPEGNEPAGADAFDEAANSAAVEVPTEPVAETGNADATGSDPWPDDVAVSAREPAEVL